MPLTSTEVREWTIYKITSPSSKVYIGLTQDINGRRKDYERVACKHQTAIYRSLKKYGFSSHSFDVVDTFVSDKDFALGKEMFWIRSFMANSGKFPKQNGLNMTDGGRGHLGKKMSEETKQKLRVANLGKKYSEETRKKLSELRTGKKINRVWTQEQREAQSIRVRGFKHTEDAKSKIAEAARGNKYCIGKKHSQELIAKRTKHSIGNKYRLGKPTSALQKKIASEAAKTILQYNLDNSFIREYRSAKDAKNELGISMWSIRQCATGNVKNPTRFIFKYKN